MRLYSLACRDRHEASICIHNTYVHIACIHRVYNACKVVQIRLPQISQSGGKGGEQIYRLLQFIVETFTPDYVLLTGGNSLTRFMRFGSGFANNYRGPTIESLGWGARLFIDNIVHAVCVFFQRCIHATKCFSSEFQNSPELNMFKNYKKKGPPYNCNFLQITTRGFGTLQAHRDT